MKVQAERFHLNGHISGFCPDSNVRTTLRDSNIHSGSERVKHHTRNTVMQVHTKKDYRKRKRYSPKPLVINPQKIITNLNYIKEFTLRAQPEPPFHFLIMDEILRGLCLNRAKPLKSPHPELLHE